MEKRLKINKSTRNKKKQRKQHHSSNAVTAIEIELIRKNLLTDVITTKDASLASIYSRHTLSAEIIKIFSNAAEQDILKVTWDSLPPLLKNFILSDISKQADFQRDRSVPGFVTKQRVRISPEKSFYFLGNYYEAGQIHEISLAGFLNPLLEYSASTRVKDAYGLEFHFRSTLPFSDFRREINTFFKDVIPAINGEKNALPDGTHQHIPAPLPYFFLSQITKYGATKEEASLCLSLYVQSLELAMIIFNSELGVGLDVVFHEDPKRAPIIDFMSKHSLAVMYRYFLAVFKGESPLLGESLKKVNVAVRSGEIYDKPELWGLELRFNHFDTCGSADHAALSDSIRRVLHSQKYPVGIDTVRKLLKQSNLDPLKALQKTWFRGNPETQIEDCQDPEIKAKLKNYMKINDLKDFTRVDGFQDSSQILFFDWASHPLLDQPALRSRIRKHQMRHIDYAVKHQNYSIKHMALFFRESGIKSALKEFLF